jgi:hypothetical protein
MSLELTVHKVTHTPQQQANAVLLLHEGSPPSDWRGG